MNKSIHQRATGEIWKDLVTDDIIRLGHAIVFQLHEPSYFLVVNSFIVIDQTKPASVKVNGSFSALGIGSILMDHDPIGQLGRDTGRQQVQTSQSSRLVGPSAWA